MKSLLFAFCLSVVSVHAQFTCTEPIPTPSGLTATAISPFQISLEWMSSTNAGQYRVQRSFDATTNWVTIITLEATDTADLQFTDKALPGGMTFFYRIQGGEGFEFCSDCCTSEFSNVASATTPAGPVTCPLDVTSVRAKLFFSRTNADRMTVRAFVCLPADFNEPMVAGNLEVCDAEFPFILDHAGIGVYVSQDGHILMHYNHRSHAWKFRAIFSRATLSPDVASCGLVNANIPPPGNPVTLPVTVSIGDQDFPGQITVNYTATVNDRGIAR